MISGLLLAWIQKLAVQHFTPEAYNLFTKTTKFTPVFSIVASNVKTLKHFINCEIPKLCEEKTLTLPYVESLKKITKKILLKEIFIFE